MATAFSLENPVFSHFAFYAIVVVLKMVAMIFLTIFRRVTKGAFSNPEDAKMRGKVVTIDPGVERVRRNHLNDLENIPMFLFVGLLYVCINPDPRVALWHFRLFAGSRILHTISYQLELQPWRGVFFGVGIFATLSMAIQILGKATY